MGGYPQPSVLAAEPPGGTCARGARGAGGARAPEAGFTLIELIVVISIIAALMGIGVAGYMAMGRGLSAEACLSSMEDTLRTARNFAIRSGSAGRVDIDTDARTMRAVGFKVVGLWHMEGPEGAFGLDLDIEEAEDVKGKIGRGVLFQGKGSYAYCGDVGDIHRQEGVYVEAWVFPMLSGQDQYIFRTSRFTGGPRSGSWWRPTGCRSSSTTSCAPSSTRASRCPAAPSPSRYPTRTSPSWASSTRSASWASSAGASS